MFKRVLVAIIFILSLGWIAYVGLDIFNNGNDFSEKHLFGAEDKQLLIINRPSEVDLPEIDGLVESPLYDLLEALGDTLYDKAYYSTSRPHLLLERSEVWSSKDIERLFSSSGKSLKLSGNEFTLGELQGRYRKSRLYVYDPNVQPDGNVLPEFVYDKKASASVLSITEEATIETVSDIYFKSGGKINYITKNDGIEQGKQIRDEVLFAPVISSKCQTYHFYERDFYATQDSIYAAGPMFQWLMNGFVQITYEGNQVIITDYIDGQDPILVLNDLTQTHDTSRFDIQLTRDFPSKGKSYSMKYLEDFVVISEKEEICDQVVADYKLGSTVALSGDKRKALYSDLPQRVSERHIGKERRLSKAVYQGYLLETRHGSAETSAVISKKTTALTCNFDILDFAVLPGQGNVVALGKGGEIACFKRGKPSWKKELGSVAIGELQIIDLHGNGEGHILLNTEDRIELWAINGDAVSGFPIQLENEATNEVKFYRWKGKSYFLVANSDGKIAQFDAQGRELNLFKSKGIVTRKIDVWASQNRLFFGYRFGGEFEMYDVDRNRSHRTFNIPQKAVTAKVPNQLFHYGIEDNRLVKYDQKGTRTTFEKYNRGIIRKVSNTNGSPILLVQSANEVHLINQQGIPFGEIRLPFNEVTGIQYASLNSGKTIIAVIDGLENNVYLYEMNGKPALERPLEGKTKVVVSSVGGSLLVTTVVDQFITQYLEN